MPEACALERSSKPDYRRGRGVRPFDWSRSCTQNKPIKLLPTKPFVKLHEAVSDAHLSDLILVKRSSRYTETKQTLQTTKMELQSSSEEEHVYALDPATEEAIKNRRSKETVRSGGQGTKSLASSYMKIALFGTGGHLLSVAYWILISLSTSYNAELGSYSLSALYVSQIGSLFVAPSLVNIIGSKACAVLSGLCGMVFAASYMYPCWYTIIPSSLLQGFACALMYATLVVTKNDEVRRVVVEKGVDEITYHGRFGAIGSVAFNSSAIVSGIITVATLSDQHNALGYHSNATSSDNDSVSYNATAQLILQSCATIASPTSGASANYTLNYYILVALCIVATILAVAIFSVGGGATYHPCRVFSFRLKSLLRDVATYAARVLKQATTPAYGMTLPLWLLMGLVTAYFFGVFTKVSSYCSFISCNECNFIQHIQRNLSMVDSIRTWLAVLYREVSLIQR